MADGVDYKLVADTVRTKWQALVEPIAHARGVEPNLALAIICQESHGEQFKNRYEPTWKYLYFPRECASRLGISYATEVVLQSMSWGLMQVMGSVARELGHLGDLGQIFDPTTNVILGCEKLQKLMQTYPLEADWIAAYNAGSPRKTPTGGYVNEATYVDPVSRYLRELRGP